VCRHVDKALDEFSPEIVVYNAGTDVLDGDALGCLSISAQVCILTCSTQVFDLCK
jgi:histone deacetylase 11